MKIEYSGDKISISSEYNSSFVTKARNLLGKFDTVKKCWVFDVKNEAYLLNALYLCYGVDGYRDNRCDIKIIAKKDVISENKQFLFMGVPLAWARYEKLDYSENIAILEGGFAKSKGYPYIKADTVLIIRDISKPMLDLMFEEYSKKYNIEIVSDNRKDRLLKEKERLTERLAEIKRLLKNES